VSGADGAIYSFHGSGNRLFSPPPLYPMASIVVDDTSSQFSYGGSPWTEVPASHFYGGSATFPAGAQDGVGGFVGYGTFNFAFQGTFFIFQ
jgi:hypothetical protein